MKNLIEKLAVFGVGALGTLYLLNPGAGIVELIPDNIPVIGNLDEAAAAALVLSALAYFGIDLKRLFGRAGEKSKGEGEAGAKGTGAVIDVQAQTVPPASK